MPTSTSLSNNVLVKKDKIQAIPLLCSVFNGSLLFVQTIHFFPVEKGLSRQKGPINSKKWVFHYLAFLSYYLQTPRIFKPGGYATAGQSLGTALLTPAPGGWLGLVSDVSVINDNFCQNKTIKQADQKNCPASPRQPQLTTQPRVCICGERVRR